MKSKELRILQELRRNSRRSLTDIGAVTMVPLSSTFKKVLNLEKNVIKRYVSLVDFNRLGFCIRINLVLKSKNRKELKKFLLDHPNVNSFYRVSQDFDFFVETIFPNMLVFEEFVENLSGLVSDKKVFHIIEDLCQEEFMFVQDEQLR